MLEITVLTGTLKETFSLRLQLDQDVMSCLASFTYVIVQLLQLLYCNIPNAIYSFSTHLSSVYWGVFSNVVYGSSSGIKS